MNSGTSSRSDAPVLRDWLSWLFAVLLVMIGALSNKAWNGLDDRLKQLEMYGATPLRMEIARLTAKVDALERQADINRRNIDQLNMDINSYRYVQPQPSQDGLSRPRFGR